MYVFTSVFMIGIYKTFLYSDSRNKRYYLTREPTGEMHDFPMFVALFSAAPRENCIFISVNRSKKKANSANYLVLIFDHHRPDFMKGFVAIQHDYQDSILASQHIHVDHHNCLETITMRGKPSVLNKLADRILALKGVKHGKLVFAAM